MFDFEHFIIKISSSTYILQQKSLNSIIIGLCKLISSKQGRKQKENLKTGIFLLDFIIVIKPKSEMFKRTNSTYELLHTSNIHFNIQDRKAVTNYYKY